MATRWLVFVFCCINMSAKGLVAIFLIILIAVVVLAFTVRTSRMEGGGPFLLPLNLSVSIVRGIGPLANISPFLIFGEEHTTAMIDAGFARNAVRIVRNISQNPKVSKIVLFAEKNAIYSSRGSNSNVNSLMALNEKPNAKFEHAVRVDCQVEKIRCDFRDKSLKTSIPSQHLFDIQRWMTDIVGEGNPIWQDREGHRKIYDHAFHPLNPLSPLNVVCYPERGFDPQILNSRKFRDLYVLFRNSNYYGAKRDRRSWTATEIGRPHVPHSQIKLSTVEIFTLFNMFQRPIVPGEVLIFACGDGHRNNMMETLSSCLEQHTFEMGKLCLGEYQLVDLLFGDNPTEVKTIRFSKFSAIYFFSEVSRLKKPAPTPWPEKVPVEPVVQHGEPMPKLATQSETATDESVAQSESLTPKPKPKSKPSKRPKPATLPEKTTVEPVSHPLPASELAAGRVDFRLDSEHEIEKVAIIILESEKQPTAMEQGLNRIVKLFIYSNIPNATDVSFSFSHWLEQFPALKLFYDTSFSAFANLHDIQFKALRVQTPPAIETDKIIDSLRSTCLTFGLDDVISFAGHVQKFVEILQLPEGMPPEDKIIRQVEAIDKCLQLMFTRIDPARYDFILFSVHPANYISLKRSLIDEERRSLIYQIKDTQQGGVGIVGPQELIDDWIRARRKGSVSIGLPKTIYPPVSNTAVADSFARDDGPPPWGETFDGSVKSIATPTKKTVALDESFDVTRIVAPFP